MAGTDPEHGPPSPSQELAALAAAAPALRDGHSGQAGGEPGAPLLALLFLRVGRRWFAVPSESVREVTTKGYVTRVPGAPVHVLGVTLVRGRLVPVLALEGLLGPGNGGEVAPTLPRLVVLRDQDMEVALVADETRGVFEHRLQSEGARSGDRPRYLGAEIEWEGRLVCLIDVAALIDHARPRDGAPS